MSMTARVGIGTLVLALLSGPAAAQTSQNAAVLLREAQRLAIIQGDLRGAAERYQQAFEAAGGDRALAAQALLGAATVSEQRGDVPAARSLYGRLVNDFADQEQVLTTARRRLTALRESPTAAITPPVSQPLPERIWTADGAVDGSLSADGRWLAYADWSEGHGRLVVRDLRTGQVARLTPDGPTGGWVGDVLMSPDGEWVAYRWEGGSDESTRIVRRDGSGARVLTRQPYGEFLERWSPDGRMIAARRHNYATDRVTQIVLIAVGDGTSTQLKSMGNWEVPIIGGFSPDGRTLLVSGENRRRERSGIVALAVDGTAEYVITEDNTVQGPAFWSHDGRNVIFARAGGGETGFWAVRVESGKPAGEPSAVMPPAAGGRQVSQIGSDGSLYFSVSNARRIPYLAEFDPTSLTVRRTTGIGDPSLNGSFPELSPDGRRVALMRQRQVVVRDLETGIERTFDKVAGLYGFMRLQWLADGQSLLVRTTDGVVALDTGSGATRIVLPEDQVTWSIVAVSPDGRSLYYSKAEVIDGRAGPADPKRIRLLKRSLETGVDAELHAAESRGLGYFGLTVSNDGTSLAFTVNVEGGQALVLLPSAGGKPVEVRRWDGASTINVQGTMTWTPDDRYLILAARCGPARSMAICAIPREGGELRFVTAHVQDVLGPTLSRDGRRLAFTGMFESPELWVIRGGAGAAPLGQ